MILIRKFNRFFRFELKIYNENQLKLQQFSSYIGTCLNDNNFLLSVTDPKGIWKREEFEG